MRGLIICLFSVGAFLEVFKVSFGSGPRFIFRKNDWQALVSGTMFALIGILIWLFS